MSWGMERGGDKHEGGGGERNTIKCDGKGTGRMRAREGKAAWGEEKVWEGR